MPEENKWIALGNSNYYRAGTSLERLGNRVFAFGGSGGPNVIEEFISADNTWITLEAKLTIHRIYHSTLMVPAQMFAHMEGGCKGII